MRRAAGWVILLVAVVMAAGCAGPPDLKRLNGAAPAGKGFVLHETPARDGQPSHKYSVFVPHDYTPASPRAAIVFLHGLGEAGTDGRRPLTMGLAPQIRRDPAQFDFIVIFPQTTGDWRSDASHALAMRVLDDAMSRYAIDPDRVILTGISTGGQGVWLIGAKYRERFAALVPIAGWAADDVAKDLTGIPIWAFHNRYDPIVPSANTARMVRKIEQAGGNIRYTAYSSASHFAWEKAYRDRELLSWIAGARRRKAE